MAKEKYIDFKLIKEMSEEQQQQIYYTLAKRANQRFRDITKKSNLNSGAVNKAQLFLAHNYGRDTFKQSKKLTGIELKENLKALETFYTSKTATAQGIKQAQKKAVSKLTESFEDKELAKKFTKGMKNTSYKKKFYEFLSSQQFKTLSKYADSNQVKEDFARAIDEGFTPDEIMKGYEEFLQNDMTFEEVEERRNRGGGELLH